ncbi:pyridoxamine 5'-phosphate oxidase family protein [Aquibacillus saliphilus]|uniref:pyridoxamine 5'-phosphate oxidase family protein n=1 Tax=Aquibacillus saliphilus TaxID=1909422 RepID=UPI001CF05379|nr:pyridoxamine 5'-phosphate oxidase family protein [Aquibacillus saliphilus]
MQQSEVNKNAEEILNNNKVGTLATVKNDKPFSRYMTFFNDSFTLYSATNNETHKVDDLNKNNNVHIIIGYNHEGLTDSYLEIEGKAEIIDSIDVKQKLWNEDLEPWFDGVDDPNLSILKVKPNKIRLMNNKTNEPQLIEF